MVKIGKFTIYFKNGTVIEKEVAIVNSRDEHTECLDKIEGLIEKLGKCFASEEPAHMEILGLHVRLSEVIAVDFQLYAQRGRKWYRSRQGK